MKTLFRLLPVTLITIFTLSCSGSEDGDNGGNNNGNTIDGITATTLTITDVKTILATVNSKVDVDAAKATLVVKGIVWSTNTNPTINLPTKTIGDNTSGNFQSQMTELQHSTTYYVRAYATDDKGKTAYGNEISFKTKVGWDKIYSYRFSSFGIKTDGTLWAWGRNDNGQLGDGTSIDKNRPVQIGTDNDWDKISSAGSDQVTNGYYTIALKKDGTLWSWGSNEVGQLGDETNNRRFTPKKISSEVWKSISAGIRYTLAVKADGTVWGWGQLFQILDPWNTQGLYINVKSPIQITSFGQCKEVYVNLTSALYIKNDGTLWGIGANSNDCLGIGSSTTNTLIFPARQIGTANWTTLYPSNIELSCTIGRQNNGNLYGWGTGANGQFGNATNVHYSTPTLITNNIGNTFNSFSMSGQMTYAIKPDGTLWGTGGGILGDGTTYGNSRFIFTQVGNLNIWKHVCLGFAKYAIQTNGSLWSCGENTFGQLGIGDESQATVKFNFTIIE